MLTAMNRYFTHTILVAATRAKLAGNETSCQTAKIVAWPSLALIAAAMLFLPTLGNAQTTQTWGGGSGVWDVGTTHDWSGSTTYIGGYDNLTFSGAGGTLTINDATNGQVTADMLTFTSGNWVIAGNTPSDTLEENPWTTNGNQVFLTMSSGSGNVTVKAPIALSDLGPNSQDYIVNKSNSTLTLENIDFGPYTLNPSNTNARAVNIQATGANATVILDGTYTTSAGHGGDIFFNGETSTGTYDITSNANFTNFNGGSNSFWFWGGILNIDNSTFTSAQTIILDYAPVTNDINLQGAQTIKMSVDDVTKNTGTKASDGVNITGEETINQSTANLSTWSGKLVQDGSNMTLEAVSGGRLVWSGQLQGGTPEGLTIGGNGVVVLANAAGNSFDEQDGDGHLQPTTNVAATLESGSTTLITNTSGSAFGGTTPGDSKYSNTGTHSFPVNLQSGATLGGTGSTTRQIVAQGATSTITAGDPGQSGLGINPKIGMLTLAGGLTTTGTNGLTFDFKLDGEGTDPGVDNDLISVSNLTLNGVVTVNITTLDTLVTGEAYTLMYGSGTWSGAPTFDITTPNGYVLDTTYNGTGYDFDTGGDSFSVQFALAPEPSVLSMLGLSLLALAGVTRWMRRGSIEDFQEENAGKRN